MTRVGEFRMLLRAVRGKMRVRYHCKVSFGWRVQGLRAGGEGVLGLGLVGSRSGVWFRV